MRNRQQREQSMSFLCPPATVKSSSFSAGDRMNHFEADLEKTAATAQRATGKTTAAVQTSTHKQKAASKKSCQSACQSAGWTGLRAPAMIRPASIPVSLPITPRCGAAASRLCSDRGCNVCSVRRYVFLHRVNKEELTQSIFGGGGG